MAEALPFEEGMPRAFFSQGEMCEAAFGHNESRDLAFTQFRLSREIYPQTEEYDGVVLTWRNLSILAKPTSLLTALQFFARIRNS